MSLYDGSKEVENGESCIYFASWSSANEIVPTPLCVPCVGIMCRDLFGVNSSCEFKLYTLAYTNTNRNPNPNVHKT